MTVKDSKRVIIKDAERYKTVMCQNWKETNACPYGHKCQFAHGEHELRVRVKPPAKEGKLRQDVQPKRTKKSEASNTKLAVAFAPTPAPTPTPLTPPGLLPTIHSEPPVLPSALLADRSTQPLMPPAACVVAPALLAFGPIDAPTTPPATSPDELARFAMECFAQEQQTACPCGLRVNQATGKVEASEACTEPPMVKRRVSSTTQLVRRAVSFLFEGEPSVKEASHKSSRRSFAASESSQKSSSSFRWPHTFSNSFGARGFFARGSLDSEFQEESLESTHATNAPSGPIASLVRSFSALGARRARAAMCSTK